MVASGSLLGLMGCTAILGFDKNVESADETFPDGGTTRPDGQTGTTTPDGGSTGDPDAHATKKDTGAPPAEPYIDETFGDRGRAEIPASISAQPVSLTATKCYLDVGSDDTIWAACGGTDSYTMSHQIARLTPEGRVDLTFAGADGGASALGNVSIGGIAAQGAKLLVGEALGGGTVAVTRRETDGGPDTTFGTNGVVPQTVGLWRGLQAMTRSGEDLLLAGISPTTPGSIGEVAVTTFVGASNTFSSTILKSPQGRVVCYYNACKAFALSDGRIFLLGITEVPPTSDAAFQINSRVYGLVRFAGGAVDSSFGNGGLVSFPTGIDGTFIPQAAENDGKDRIVISGYAGSNATGGLVRFTKDGTLDSSFGSGGLLPFDIPSALTPASGIETILAITPLQNDRFYVGGTYMTKTKDYRSFVARLMADGSVDTTFANQGFAFPVVRSDASFESVFALKVQKDGALLAGGVTGGSMFVLRFKP